MAKLNGIRKTKDGIDIYAPSDFEGMRKAGAVAAKILDDVIEVIEPGKPQPQLIISLNKKLRIWRDLGHDWVSRVSACHVYQC